MELPITAQGLITACTSPRVCRVESFLTDTECAVLIAAAYPRLQPAYAGLQAGEGRTSQGCELPCELPAAASVLRKVRGLVRLPFERMEEVYVSRYSRGQRYDTHHDAPDESDPDAERFLASGGGQRVATVLVYLNTVASGGQTTFPLAGLAVAPRRGAPHHLMRAAVRVPRPALTRRCSALRTGMALVFFPATLDGRRDDMALHGAMPADDTKWVAQVWIRQRRAADPLLHSLRSALDSCPDLDDPLQYRRGGCSCRAADRRVHGGADTARVWTYRPCGD